MSLNALQKAFKDSNRKIIGYLIVKDRVKKSTNTKVLGTEHDHDQVSGSQTDSPNDGWPFVARWF